MRIIVGTLLFGVSLSVKTNLRNRDVNLSNLITVPSLDQSSTTDTYTGVQYSSDSNSFSLDVGSTARQMSIPTVTNPLNYVPSGTDYGMQSVTFTAPQESFATNMTGYTPHEYQVSGCMPSSNTGDCGQGNSQYGLALPRIYAAK